MTRCWDYKEGREEMSGEDREFRVYADSKGEQPVATAHGTKELDLLLRFERQRLPGNTLTVREVVETVIAVYYADGVVSYFGNTTDFVDLPPTV